MHGTMRSGITSRVMLASLLLGSGAAPRPLAAQEADSVRLARLERQMEALSLELERLQLGQEVVVADSSVPGLGPAGSRVYQVEGGVSVGGYGEVLYENFAQEAQDGSTPGPADRFDALRAIVYLGYKFNDRLLINSEIELEHADEAFLEFAYVDYRVGDQWGLRGGLLLAPLGLVNELHEPPTYLGTERPLTESRIIPTTWRANGIGAFGGTDALAWRVYVMNSLDGSGFDASGLRGGRQKGSQALAEDLGVAGRLDFVGTPGLLVGASAFVGETAHNREVGGQQLGARTLIWDVHADYERSGWDVRALVAGASLDEAAELNQLTGLTGPQGVGTRMLGWYGQIGYDVLRSTTATHQLIPYIRYERLDTQRGMAAGAPADPAQDQSVTMIGLAWKPVPQVAAKVDYQAHSNQADTGVSQLAFQLGWYF